MIYEIIEQKIAENKKLWEELLKLESYELKKQVKRYEEEKEKMEEIEKEISLKMKKYYMVEEEINNLDRQLYT